MTYGDQLDRPIEKLGFYADLAETLRVRARAWTTATAAGRTGSTASPSGVVGAITPWNIPIELDLAKVGAALAAGCTVVLKPSPLSPWSATHLGRLAAERTDIPAGVFNVVSSASDEVAALLTSDPRVDAVAFTGSTATGKRVMAAAAGSVKRVMLELGGKSASIVLDDADLEGDRAARRRVRVLQRRPELHPAVAPARAPQAPRALHRARGRGAARGAGGRSVRSRARSWAR